MQDAPDVFEMCDEQLAEFEGLQTLALEGST